jgi:hypothetical protein
MSNCYCLEFSFANISEFELSYTNCSGNTVTETFYSGETYNICSQDFDPITNCIDINFEVKGFCIDNACPGDYFKYRNECDVTTIFPMGVQCFVEQPSGFGLSDGVVSLLITGGTPPYYINWQNGSHAQTITNLGPGQYAATVIDFYGDFTANTTCVLTAATPTPSITPTPTPTPLPSLSGLCLIVEGRLGKIPYLELIDFTYNGYYNGKPSWTSVPSGYDIVWVSTNNQWEVSGWTNGSITNLNPASPPVTGWQTIGSGGITQPSILSVDVNEGSCESQNILRYELTVNNPTCEQKPEGGVTICDGSIIFNIIDGNPPYSYSINGLNFFPNQPIFQNLCSGLYTTVVTDASGQTFSQAVTLTAPPAPQIYTITLVLNLTLTAFDIIVTPSLPTGAYITFDLVHQKNLASGPTANAYTWNNVVTTNKNSLPVPFTNTITNGTTSLLVCNIDPTAQLYSYTTTTTWSNLTLTQNDVINGTVTNPQPVLNVSPLTPCLFETHSYNLFLSNVTLNDCPCCTILIKNPPKQGKVI